MSQGSDVSKRTIRAVIFDLDGTLLDTAPDFIVVLNRLLAEFEQPPLPDEVIRRTVSNGAKALVTLAFGVGEDDPRFEPLRRRLLELYSEHLAVGTRLFPGIAELLEQLREQNIPWGIATNKPAIFTLPILEALQIQPPPVSVICPDHVQERKPHPESMYLAARHANCEPHEILYVGDHWRDIECGRRAGAITVAAAYGYIDVDDNVDDWQADYRVEHAREIWDIIEHLQMPTEPERSRNP